MNGWTDWELGRMENTFNVQYFICTDIDLVMLSRLSFSETTVIIIVAQQIQKTVH